VAAAVFVALLAISSIVVDILVVAIVAAIVMVADFLVVAVILEVAERAVIGR
jgi:hypothetical protein